MIGVSPYRRKSTRCLGYTPVRGRRTRVAMCLGPSNCDVDCVRGTHPTIGTMKTKRKLIDSWFHMIKMLPRPVKQFPASNGGRTTVHRMFVQLVLLRLLLQGGRQQSPLEDLRARRRKAT